ncbi:hypothetical protein Ac2012v2_000015 [Leucoagaricus gongylophorus]
MDPNDQRKLEIVPIKPAILTGFGFPSNTAVWVLGHISTRPETIFEDMPFKRRIMRMRYYLPSLHAIFISSILGSQPNVLIPYTLYSVTIVMQCGGSSMKTRT